MTDVGRRASNGGGSDGEQMSGAPACGTNTLSDSKSSTTANSSCVEEDDDEEHGAQLTIVTEVKQNSGMVQQSVA